MYSWSLRACKCPSILQGLNSMEHTKEFGVDFHSLSSTDQGKRSHMKSGQRFMEPMPRWSGIRSYAWNIPSMTAWTVPDLLSDSPISKYVVSDLFFLSCGNKLSLETCSWMESRRVNLRHTDPTMWRVIF